MAKFYFEKPSLARKQAAQAYVDEFMAAGSAINGAGGLHLYRDAYEAWLEKLQADEEQQPTQERVPARTYFLVREDDDKLVGMANIRLGLNEKLKEHGGNIGYTVRPSERGQGYAKIILYLTLREADKYGLTQVLLDANINNPASWRTMEALGGKRTRQVTDERTDVTTVYYQIDVKQALANHPEYLSWLVTK